MSNKKPRSFSKTGFISQSIFPSSMVTWDGSFSTASHLQDLLPLFASEIYYIIKIIKPDTFRTLKIPPTFRKIKPSKYECFIRHSIKCSKAPMSRFVFAVNKGDLDQI